MANIAVDARPLCNPLDGIARYTYEILSRLVRRKEHRWFLYSHRPILPNVANSRARISPPWFNHGLLSSQVLFPPWAKSDSIDVFWAPRHHIPHKLKVPSLLSVHDLAWLKAPSTMPVSRRLQERLLMPSSIRQAVSIATVSQATLNQMLEFAPDAASKSKVISPGRATLTGDHKRLYLRPYILAVGTIEPRKNYPLLLQAFRKIMFTVEQDLVIAGRAGWGGLNILQTVKNMGLQARVHIVNSPQDQTLANYYKYADYLVSTSAYEGFNIPLLESISLGTPVIAADIPVHREVAGKAGCYFVPHKEALAATFANVLGNDQLRKSLTKHCDFEANKFSWDRSADAILSSLLAICR